GLEKLVRAYVAELPRRMAMCGRAGRIRRQHDVVRGGGIARINPKARVSHYIQPGDVRHEIELLDVRTLSIDKHAKCAREILPPRFLRIDRVRSTEKGQLARLHVIENLLERRRDEKIGIEKQRK